MKVLINVTFFLLLLVVEYPSADAQAGQIKPILVTPGELYSIPNSNIQQDNSSAFDLSESISDFVPQKPQVLLDLDNLGDIENEPPQEIQVQIEIDGETKLYKLSGKSSKKHWYGENGNDEMNLYQYGDGSSVIGSMNRNDGKICDIMPVEVEHPNRRKLRKKNASGFGKKSPKNLHRIDCRDSNEYPPEADSPMIVLNDSSKKSMQEKSPLRKKIRQSAPRDYERRKLNANDLENNLDVMVVWTKKAECAHGTETENCEPDDTTDEKMRALVELAINESNLAFEKSGIDTRLRLVHAYRHPEYVERVYAFDNALTDITFGRNNMHDVHSNRTKYGADLVALMIHDGQYCGIGWNGPFKEYMFSVSSWKCATGYYSFSHEIAHNLGCQHDRGSAGKCSDPGMNFGYRDPDAKFRSILSYDCVGLQCDRNKGGGCQRVQRFSNQKYKYNNAVIGNPENDNASSINMNAPIAAAYYGAKCFTNEDCIDDAKCDMRTGICTGPNKVPTCKNGEKFVDITISTDYYPRETSWKLVNICTDEVVHIHEAGAYELQNYDYEIEFCVPQGEYEFVINDEFGDGICCDYGIGWYVVNYDGAEAAIGWKFNKQEKKTFGSCDVGPAPSNVPTVGPTVVPSKKPSVEPSLTPSNIPTSVPSHVPGLFSAQVPSKVPTISPSTKPTHVPSKKPSVEPSLTPSNIPTSAPSGVPSLVPTKFPSKVPTISPSTKPTRVPSFAPSGSPSTPFSSIEPVKSPSFQQITVDNFNDKYTSYEFSKKGKHDKKKGYVKLKGKAYMQHKDVQTVSEYSLLEVSFKYMLKFTKESEVLRLETIDTSKAVTKILKEYTINGGGNNVWLSDTFQFQKTEGINLMGLRFIVDSKKEAYIDDVVFRGSK